MIALRHRDTDRTVNVRDGHVPGLLARGWEYVDKPPDRPAESASKGEWVDYAASMGWNRDDAEATTKADLTDLL